MISKVARHKPHWKHQPPNCHHSFHHRCPALKRKKRVLKHYTNMQYHKNYFLKSQSWTSLKHEKCIKLTHWPKQKRNGFKKRKKKKHIVLLKLFKLEVDFKTCNVCYSHNELLFPFLLFSVFCFQKSSLLHFCASRKLWNLQMETQMNSEIGGNRRGEGDW